MKRKILLITIILIIAFTGLSACGGNTSMADSEPEATETATAMELISDTVEIELGSEFLNEPKDYFTGIEEADYNEFVVEGDVDADTAGSYPVILTVGDISYEVTVIVSDTTAPEIEIENDTEFGIYSGTAVVLLPEYNNPIRAKEKSTETDETIESIEPTESTGSTETIESTESSGETQEAQDAEAVFIAAHDSILDSGAVLTCDNPSVFYFYPLHLTVTDCSDVTFEIVDVKKTLDVENEDIASFLASETSVDISNDGEGTLTCTVTVAYDSTLESADVREVKADGTTESTVNQVLYDAGEYDLTVKATDVFGNASEQVIHVILDRFTISSYFNGETEAYACLVNPASESLRADKDACEQVIEGMLLLNSSYFSSEKELQAALEANMGGICENYRADLVWSGLDTLDNEEIFAAYAPSYDILADTTAGENEDSSGGTDSSEDISAATDSASTGTQTVTDTESEKEAQARAVAQQIADSITGGSDLEKVRQAAQIVSAYCANATYTSEDPDYRTAYGVFCKGVYTCAGSTRALGMVLECMGYSWEHVNANLYTHQWCKVTIDGQNGWADGMGGIADYGECPFASGGSYTDSNGVTYYVP